MNNSEPKQYCVTVEVWVVALHEPHAATITKSLLQRDLDVEKFEIKNINEVQS